MCLSYDCVQVLMQLLFLKQCVVLNNRNNVCILINVYLIIILAVLSVFLVSESNLI